MAYPTQGAAAMPMQMAPAPQMMAPAPVVVVSQPTVIVQGSTFPDTLTALAQTPGLYIKEKIKLLQTLTDYQQENTFDASAWNPACDLYNPRTGKGADLFVLKEQSDCLQRQFCGPLRAFDMGMVPASPVIGTFNPQFLHRDFIMSSPDALVFHRPFACSCLCFNRPRLYMKHNTLGRFATVTNPWALCSHRFDIMAATAGDGGDLVGPVSPTIAGEQGRLWYRVKGTICQPAAFCFCPFGECSRFHLEVYDGADTEMTTPIGSVARVFNGCCKAELTQADDFTLQFPQGQHEHGLKRASLVASVILLNYLFFNKKKDRNRDDGLGMMAGGFN